ncbi:MAG: hypothetical protein PHO37_11885 [Kiritimatiellae bacterium]|nr:hypothetical protein [Kiritimatiellia bacterium]
MVKKSIIGRREELVRCLHCGIMLRHDSLSAHISKKHASQTISSALESKWLEKKCKQCATIIFIKSSWKTPSLRCPKCFREKRLPSKKVDKKKGKKRKADKKKVKHKIYKPVIARLGYARVSYSYRSFHGGPIQGDY